MYNDIHIMTDVESQDTEETAIIMQIGIVAFSLTRREILSKALIPINIELQTGRTQSADTMAWWDEKPNKAEVFGLSETQGLHPKLAANMLNFIFSVTNGSMLWSQGHFDYPMIKNFMRDYGIEAPWKYSKVKDLRSVYDMAVLTGFNSEKTENNHNALDDALNQVNTLFQIYDFHTKTGGK